MESDLLALHWMEHASVFSKAVGNLRTKTSYTDATLACDGHFYPVHKFVLSTCSQYFNAIFEWTPCINPVVVINNVTCKELEALLDFMYTGEVSVKDSLIPDIMQAAECLKIRGLSLLDDDATKSKTKTDPVEPARKRRRTTASKRKCSTYAHMNIPSTSYMSESNHNSCVSPPVSMPSHQLNNNETLNHTENHSPEPDYTPPQRNKIHPQELHSYDTNMTHASSQHNAPSTFMQTMIPPSPPPQETLQPLKPVHSPPNTMVNVQINTSPPHVPAPSHSNALDVPPEPTPEVPMHSVIDMKPEKMELVETKIDSPQGHSTVSAGEIPHFLDTMVEMPAQIDEKSESANEDPTLDPEESNENLYEYSENFASVSTAPTALPSQEEPRRKKKEPSTSGASRKKKQDSRDSNEERPTFKCPICEKEFKKKDGLTRHKRIHNKEPYVCKFCPFSTTSYKISVDHRKNEHGSCQKCTLCDFTCQNYEALRQHLSAHEKIHKCTKCKFRTARPDNLGKHIKRKHEKK